MVKNENVERRGFLSRLLAGGLWISAAAMAFSGWIRGEAAPAAGGLRNPDVQFEATDISARAVVWTVSGIVVTTWILVCLLYLLFSYFANVHQEESPRPLPITSQGPLVPPEPRIQESPARDLHDVRSSAQLELDKYSWSDRGKGTVNIPIDRAIDLLAHRGIPARRAPANMFFEPTAGTRRTGFEGKVEPEPR